MTDSVQPVVRVARVKSLLSGVLLLDKPVGISSQSAVSRVKRLLGVAKAGHTGTLDPLATGLLPICVGEATKFSHVLLEADKTYEASIRLGVTTTTGDREGATTSTSPVAVPRNDIEEVLARFIGEIDQVPPMFSAIKHQGRPLYKLAREGIVVARIARRVRIHLLDLVEIQGDVLRVKVVCGKGTYIRVLAEDIGRTLGCGASLDALRRTAVGTLRMQDAICLEALEAESPGKRAERLFSVDAPVEVLPRIDMDPAQAQCLIHGRLVQHRAGDEVGLVRLYDASSGRFLGVGTRDASGTITPRRLMVPLEKANIA